MIDKAAVIGGGVIGGGWVARLLQNGVNVAVFDIDPDAPRKIAEILQNANAAIEKLTVIPRPPTGQLTFAPSIAAAVSDAQIIIEAAPEQPALKQKIYGEIETAATETALITSSTSGIRPTELQKNMQHPARFIVAHPFNPVYLLPLVELVGGEQTSEQTITTASQIFTNWGMHPLIVKKEIDAFIADRLLETVWREALWLIKDGVATTEEIDDAIRFGFGLRWAQMGLFETYRIAGGEAGMEHFIAQFGPCLQWPWSKLTDVPELTDEFVKTIAAQSDSQSGAYSIRELEQIRDNNLIAFLQSLKANNWGAGKTLANYESKLRTLPQNIASDGPARFVTRRVPSHWTDFNQHMNESRYLECFSDASDALMNYIGADAAYIAAGNSYFTVETHIRHLQEITAGELLHVDTQVLSAEGKKLRICHTMKNDSGEILATGEQLLIHVDLKTRRSALPQPPVATAAAKLAEAHANLDLPEGVKK